MLARTQLLCENDGIVETEQDVDGQSDPEDALCGPKQNAEQNYTLPGVRTVLEDLVAGDWSDMAG